jgi:hypothetical protein
MQMPKCSETRTWNQTSEVIAASKKLWEILLQAPDTTRDKEALVVFDEAAEVDWDALLRVLESRHA